MGYSVQYFIPFPALPFLSLVASGTLGVVSQLDTLFIERERGFDYGIIANLTGFILSIVVVLIGMRLSYPTYIDLSTLGEVGLFYTESALMFTLKRIGSLTNLFSHIDPAATAAVFNPMFIAGEFGIMINGIFLLPAIPAFGGFSSESMFKWKIAKIIGIITGVILILSLNFFAIFGVLIIINYISRKQPISIQITATKIHWSRYVIFPIIVILALMSLPVSYIFYYRLFTGQLF